ncbi:MAG: DNA-3-methyladenine glycosylase I [Bacteroidales bacterium]|nr:DNA-3-methyladenine glycosylase I [Bacteroidales bacterium]
MEKQRCNWTKNDLKMNHYHDTEWGVAVHDDKKLFEFILLDTFQAGLSWKTILYKRENFREAFDDFDFEKIAFYNEDKVSELLNNKGIIRNKLKIKSAITNAKLFIEIREKYGSFDKFIWKFVDGKTIKNKWNAIQDVPATSTESDKMSKELKKLGFKFVGSTICYAFMQGAGMVNDHLITCFRYNKV